jgi:uracil-DNA glycosylase
LQPTPTEAELLREQKKNKEHKKTDVIEYLLKTIRPKVVLAHGGKAKNFFRRRCRDFVEDSVTPRKVTWDAWQWQFRLLCSPQLSFRGRTHQWAAEEAERIGHVLADALRLTTPTR